jgi:glycosyltransferase involved in cell wall biosynthesis
MPSTIDLSVVVPVYNEQESVVPLYQRVREACDSLGIAYEIVFVDDGSRDRTFPILEGLHETDKAIVRVVRFRRNYGQTAAMVAGFRAARGKIVVSMDGDLQNDPKDIPAFLGKMREGYDVVCGWRKNRKDKFLSRKLPSKVANWLIGKITGVPIHDNGCSLKAYTSEVIKRVPLYAEMHRFIPAMSTLTGARIAEIVVRHHARQFGKSKYGISRAWRVFLDLFLIKMLVGFSSKPALWFSSLSLPAMILGFGCVISALFIEEPGIVLPVLSLLFLLMAGHLIAMGVLGEMILKTGTFSPIQILAKGTFAKKGRLL